MKKGLAYSIIAVLAVLTIAFAAIHFTNNADKTKQIETLNADVADKASQIETLNADVADKAGQIETLNADVTDKAGQIEALNADVADKASQIETLNADVTDKAGQIETLNADVASKAEEIKILNANVADKAGQIETLNADVADKAGQIETLNADVAGKAEEIKTLNADVASKAEEIKTLNADVAGKAEQIEALNADVAGKEEQIKTLNADVAEKAKEIETLNAAVKEKDSQIKTLSTEVKEKTGQIESLTTSVTNQEEQIKKLNEDNEAKDLQISSLNEALEKANKASGSNIKPEAVEPFVPVLSGEDWEISKEYQFSNIAGYHYCIVFRHSKEIDQKTTVNFVFYDKENNIIGAYDDYVGCTGHGYDYFAEGINDAPYDHVKVSFSFSDLKKSTHCMDGLKIETSKVNNKVIITAENVGEKPVSSCSYDIVFFDDSGKVINSRMGYLDIPDSEMQKGQTITLQCDMYYETFASYEFYYNAVNFGN